MHLAFQYSPNILYRVLWPGIFYHSSKAISFQVTRSFRQSKIKSILCRERFAFNQKQPFQRATFQSFLNPAIVTICFPDARTCQRAKINHSILIHEAATFVSAENCQLTEFVNPSINENFTFFILGHNVECMQRAGIRGHFTIHRYCPCQRALNLQIGLKPA
jgi:hypothetical protein